MPDFQFLRLLSLCLTPLNIQSNLSLGGVSPPLHLLEASSLSGFFSHIVVQ